MSKINEMIRKAFESKSKKQFKAVAQYAQSEYAMSFSKEDYNLNAAVCEAVAEGKDDRDIIPLINEDFVDMMRRSLEKAKQTRIFFFNAGDNGGNKDLRDQFIHALGTFTSEDKKNINISKLVNILLEAVSVIDKEEDAYYMMEKYGRLQIPEF